MANTTKAINNPTYLGSMIAGQKYQANQGLPNEYDVDAELFGNVKKQFGGDGKPRGVDALISGLATGAEYGSKMKGIGLRKEELAKYNKVMDYFMAANMEAEKANKKHQEKQAKIAEISPFANSLYVARGKGADRNYLREMGLKSFNALKSQGIVDGFFSDIDPDTLTAMYTTPDGKKDYVDLNPFVTKDARETVTQDIARMGAETSRMKADLEPEKIAIDRDRVKAYNRDIDNRWDPNSNFDVAAAKEQGKKGNEMALKYQDANMELEDVQDSIGYLKDLLGDKNNVITGQTIGSKLSRMLGLQGGTKAYSDTELFDATAKGLYLFTKGSASFGNANQKEFEFLTEPVPNSMKTKETLKRLLDRYDQKVKKTISRNDRFITKYENFNSYEAQESSLSQNSKKAVNPNQTGNTEAGTNQNVAYTKMIKPDGSIVAVPTNKVYEKIQLDYRPIK